MTQNLDDEEFWFSAEIQSFADSCKACFLKDSLSLQKKKIQKIQKLHDDSNCCDDEYEKKHQHFYPSSSFMEP
jgi:hypothetical protein